MIPCLICGKDIKGGWWQGFPPAPDSQKIGLCHQHDTPENRGLAEKAWERSHIDALHQQQISYEARHRPSDVSHTILIQFKDGGRIILQSLEHEVLSSENLLSVTLKENEKCFYPLQQIRYYKVISGEQDSQPAPPPLPPE